MLEQIKNGGTPNPAEDITNKVTAFIKEFGWKPQKLKVMFDGFVDGNGVKWQDISTDFGDAANEYWEAGLAQDEFSLEASLADDVSVLFNIVHDYTYAVNAPTYYEGMTLEEGLEANYKTIADTKQDSTYGILWEVSIHKGPQESYGDNYIYNIKEEC